MKTRDQIGLGCSGLKKVKSNLPILLAFFILRSPHALAVSSEVPAQLFHDLVGTLMQDPSLTAATREFGPVVIKAGTRLPHRTPLGTATHKPWSSWWFPYKDDFLFKDENSPLAKYDLFRRARYRVTGKAYPPSAQDYEREHSISNAQPWEGLCDAWSLAAILKPEPKRPVTFTIDGKSVTFSIADLKALLLKTYEAVDDSKLAYYGQKFTGDERGWVYPDIFPDQFHRLLEVFLYERKQPFIMDHDPGVEIWNVPVFKTNFTLAEVPGDPNSVTVRTWVYSAEPARTHEKDCVGTRETTREYFYILHGSRNRQGDLVIQSGQWAKGPNGVDSMRNHPDFVTAVPNPLEIVRKSYNPEIDVSLVDEILLNSFE
jgi:hypothetical protein